MSRRKLKRLKPLPAILKTPIRYKLGLLDGLRGSMAPAAEAEGQRAWEEIVAKVKALADYHDVKLAKIDPTSDLFSLVIAMAAKHYPGFQFKPEGAPVTRKTEWTLDRKTKLLAIMRGCMEKGMTESQAAEEYRQYHWTTYNIELGARGITNRFHEFKAWESGSRTTQEELDLLRRLHRQRSDLTALTKRLERARPH